jgi:hypothetical protein
LSRRDDIGQCPFNVESDVAAAGRGQTTAQVVKSCQIHLTSQALFKVQRQRDEFQTQGARQLDHQIYIAFGVAAPLAYEP